MAISRYYGPKAQEYVSQFVPENLQLMQNAINMRQSQYNQNKEKLDLYEDMLLKQGALEGYDTEVLKGIRSEFDKYNEELLGKDLADPAVARDVSRFVRNFQRDDRIKNLNEGLALKAKHDEIIEKLKTSGKYADENDLAFIKAYQDYRGQEGEKQRFAAEFLRGTELVNPDAPSRPELEKLVDNVKATAFKKDRVNGMWILKSSGEAVTRERLEGIMAQSYKPFMQTQAGEQLARRAEMLGVSPLELFQQEVTPVIEERIFSKTGQELGTNYNYWKIKEQQEEDLRAMLSVGNTTIGQMGIIGDKPDDGSILDKNLNMVKGMLGFTKDFVTEAAKVFTDPDNAFGGKNEAEWLSESFEKNARTAQGLQNVPKERVMTAAYNFRNSMTEEQLKGFKNLSSEEKNKKFEEFLDIMPKLSVELQGEVPLDRERRRQLDELVNFNSSANVPVTVLEGDATSNQPTLDEYKKAGYKVKDSFILKSNPVSPGERLVIELVSDNGDIARVSTKGSIILGSSVDRFIPSEVNSYTSDILTQAKYNYENSTYTIPLDANEYYQVTDKTVLNSSDYKPQGLYLQTKVNPDNYTISIGAGDNAKSLVVSTKDSGGNAYNEYKKILTHLSDITNQPIPQEEKERNIVAYMNAYQEGALRNNR